MTKALCRSSHSTFPKNIKVDWVFHYSNQVARKKFEDKFREVVGP